MEQFKKAFAWMQRVQEACLFTPGISIDLECQFTPANHKEGSIDGFTCRMTVMDKERNERISAEYLPWYGWDLFCKQKADVETFLAGNGIHIIDMPVLTEQDKNDLGEAVLGRIKDIAEVRNMTRGLNVPGAVDIYDKEIKKYNEILAKLV